MATRPAGVTRLGEVGLRNFIMHQGMGDRTLRVFTCCSPPCLTWPSEKAERASEPSLI